MMLFSERYSDLIVQEGNALIDNICGDIDYQIKIKVANVMRCFAEPQIFCPNRYNNNYKVNTTALEAAADVFNKRKDMQYFQIGSATFSIPGCDSLAAAFTPYLFDVIELQYEQLSDGEKPEFQKELNNLLNENDVPWLLHDGVMIKIDPVQFEQDIRNKALAKLEELKDADSRFAPAYSELRKAFEFYEKQEYGEAINNAEKSYESILKVICNANKGTADRLTKNIIDSGFISLPESMDSGAFREKVLMSLPFLRNNSSAAHGAGEKTIGIPRELTHLALNLAASLDTYLIEEYKK